MTTEQIFANNFWGLKDDGFHVLTAKMNSTKKTFDEIKSFYNVRASLHEEFGRKLMKHAKVGMGREETGTLQALLSSAHKEMEWTAQAHLNLAQKLKTRLEVDLDNFILEQKDKRKLTHTNVEKAHRYKQSNEAYLSKVKEKYESDCAKLITLQTQVASATGREAERVKQRIGRTQHEIKIQEQEYKNACIKVADATETWNRTWKMTCDTYQGMEKKRLEFLRHSFSMYINVLSTTTSQDQESYERFWKSLDQYDPMTDIQVLINEKGTGPQIPEPEIFVDYMDDPTKTFQQHTIAKFLCPPELSTSSCSPVEPQPKPELTVRNPTATVPTPINTTVTQTNNHEEESVLLQRVKSITISPTPLSSTIADPPTPSKSTTERKKSIIRNVIRPLPSISTPIIQQKNRHQRKLSTHESYSSGSQQPMQPPPTLVVPEISSSSTTSVSDEATEEENFTTTRKSRKKKEEDGDITIDPRAKVVFAIGNNMFDLGHLDLNDNKKHLGGDTSLLNGGTSTTRRLTTTKRRQPSADLEAACNFSYQSLLEELGVFDTGDKSSGNSSGSSSHASNRNTASGDIKLPPSESVSRPRATGISTKRISVRENRPLQQQQQLHQPAIKNDGYHSTTSHINKNAVPPIMHNNIQQQQQDMHDIANIDPYRQQQPHQQQYYNQYPTQSTASSATSQQQPINIISPIYYSTAPTNAYGPPSTAAQTGHQPTLFWVIAIGDWYNGKTEELQYSRGTWMAVTETRSDGWYYATKFDTRLNILTNEKGYVARNYVQVHHA